MTRKELVEAIYDNDDKWSCPRYTCGIPEEKGNIGEYCLKCAEKLLKEYEDKISADAIEEYKSNLLEQFVKFDKEHGYPTLADISVILSDVAEQLKNIK